MKQTILLALVALLFAACGTTKDIVLMNDIAVPGQYPTPPRQDMRIKKGDNIQIVVSHHDPTVVRLFNQLTAVESQQNGSLTPRGYIVSSTGYVSLPIFDSVFVAGRTCKEVSEHLSARLEEEGIAYGATVNVRIAAFKVTVIGETGTGIFTFEDNGATLFDLVAQANLAGAMSGDTRRDKILVMREYDTAWHTDYISLLSADILSSPYFYLQQNDVFYVYPSRESVWRSNKQFDFWMNRITMFTSIASLIATVILYSTLKK